MARVRIPVVPTIVVTILVVFLAFTFVPRITSAAPTAYRVALPMVVAPTVRQPTGDGNTLSFNKGDTVIGVDISLADGTTYHSCLLRNAPQPGTVKSGVIQPWDTEMASAQACTQTAPAPVRQPTGDGNTLSFNKGDTVIGVDIVSDYGDTYRNCLLEDAVTGGTVKSGVIWPNAKEQAQARSCGQTQGGHSLPRQPTGDGNTLSFAKYYTVIGVDISLADGTTYHDCFFRYAPQPGTVKSGIVWPWDFDLLNSKPCAY